MVYRTYIKAIRELKPEQKIWACAYEFNKSKSQMELIQKPVYGIIKGKYRPEYFIPFKKKSKTELAISKQVSIYARCYADTEEECKELYNQLVKEQIDWFEKRIEETKKDLI